MKIHLLRHFKVKDNTSSWLTSDGFNQWVEEYDKLPLVIKNITLPEEINLIISSTLSRAKRTVKELPLPLIETIYTDSLREVGSRVFFKTEIKLQKYIWFTMGSFFWYFNLLDGENRVDSEKRAKDLVCQIRAFKKESILIVSHGFFMKVLAKELKKENFLGEIDFRPKNGKIYTFSL